MKNYYNEKGILIQRGLLNRTIPSKLYDTTATSSCAPTNTPLRNMGVRSYKLFMVATGDISPELEKAELPYDVHG